MGMAQIFHPSTNTIARATIVGAILILGAVGAVAWQVQNSPYVTEAGIVKGQPVPFSHEHHVSGLGIDCRYCHTTVADSSFAGVPPTKVCMSCHSQIWTNAQLLAPVRQSWRDNRPIAWTRVHNLPDYAHFYHDIHINKGIGCNTCHGEVDKMPLMFQNASLQMQWCLNCHRNPAQYIRPREEVFNMHYDVEHDPKRPGETQATLGPKLIKQYHVLEKQQMQSCSTCHY
jgi:hypothetical protein